jgi:rhodanese-related sulfurtransferase
MNSVNINELVKRVQAGEKLRLLDVRSPAEYSRIHAAGACLIPLEEVSPATIASARLLGSQEPLYVLCHSGMRAAAACEKLDAMGVKNAVRIDGGTVAWEKASLPVIRQGAAGMSIERQVRIGAGALVLIGLALAWVVHPAFAGLSAFIGAGLVFAGITDFCGMGILLSKMPWNRNRSAKVSACANACEAERPLAPV